MSVEVFQHPDNKKSPESKTMLNANFFMIKYKKEDKRVLAQKLIHVYSTIHVDDMVLRKLWLELHLDIPRRSS